MQPLHWGWIAVGALALVAFLWWMQLGEPMWPAHRATHGPDTRASAGKDDGDGPTLYRWVDAHGVVNFTTDPPPPGRKFRIVHIDPNRNIVPMASSPDDDAPTPTKAR